MEETAVTETTPIETEQTTPDAEPVIEQTTQTQEPEAVDNGTSESSEVADLKPENTESIVKALKDTKAELTRLQTERAKEKALIEQAKFEQTKTQVETGNVQLKQEYETVLTNISNWKRNARAEALASYHETGDATAYDYALESIDNQFDQAKGQLDNNYRNVETQLTQQQRELLTQAQQRNLQAFKSENQEFCEKYQPVIDKYIELGYDPQDLGVVKDLLNLAIATETSKNELAKENSEAKQKLVSSSTSGTSGTESHIFTRAEIAKMSTTEYIKHEKTIDKQMTQGLIK